MWLVARRGPGSGAQDHGGWGVLLQVLHCCAASAVAPTALNEVLDMLCSLRPMRLHGLDLCACDVTDLSCDVFPGACCLASGKTPCGPREVPEESDITTLDLTIKGYFLRVNESQKYLLIVRPSLEASLGSGCCCPESLSRFQNHRTEQLPEGHLALELWEEGHVELCGQQWNKVQETVLCIFKLLFGYCSHQESQTLQIKNQLKKQ